MLKYWMVWRYLKDGRRYLSLTFLLSVTGVALGVAALVISMAVVSGYEATLRRTVMNLQGHLMVMQQGGVSGDFDKIENNIREVLPDIKVMTRFVIVDGLIVHKKKLNGIILEGVDPIAVKKVLSLEAALSEGELQFTPEANVPNVLIGKGIAKKFELRMGDEFKLVIPVSRGKLNDGVRPKMQKFKVRGILDLGRTDFDERYIITDLKSAQNFGEVQGRISGWRVRLFDYNNADQAVKIIEDKLGFPYWAKSWGDVNRNLFQAVKYERAVIFIIVLLMIVAAAFNVASTLFLSVVRRYAQISILKAMGASNQFVRELFTRQGLIIGFVGALFGIILGWGGCQIFLWAERVWTIFPGEVYKLDYVDLEIRPLDLALILLSTMAICYLSTLAPARRGAKLLPVEGLKYE